MINRSLLLRCDLLCYVDVPEKEMQENLRKFAIFLGHFHVDRSGKESSVSLPKCITANVHVKAIRHYRSEHILPSEEQRPSTSGTSDSKFFYIHKRPALGRVSSLLLFNVAPHKHQP